LKISFRIPSVGATALLAVALIAVNNVVQAQQSPAPQAQASPAPVAASSHADHDHDHIHAAPTNLKVLPKNLTGEQVHEIMEGWETELGVHCSTCHAADPKNIGLNGKPKLNYADDSREEKATARLMYTMTENINVNYVSKVEGSEAPVTCGTCHRGHLGPEPFVIPKDDHDGPHPPAAAAPASH
jgi:hypothetical protein